MAYQIVIVDDQDDRLNNIANEINKFAEKAKIDIDLTLFTNGKEAYDFIVNNDIDILLIEELYQDNMHGPLTVESLRQNETNKDLPIIAYSDIDDLWNAKQKFEDAGVNHFFIPYKTTNEEIWGLILEYLKHTTTE